MSHRRDTRQREGFFALLPDAFVFPFRGKGVAVLVGGAVSIWLGLFFAQSLPIVGLFLAIGVMGYLCAIMVGMIEASAYGARSLPALPRLTDLVPDILVPLFRVGLTVLISFLPLIVCSMVAPSPRLVILGLIVSLLYLPMALLAVSVSHSLSALSPTIILPSIFRVPLEYLTACALLAFVIVLRGMATVYVEALVMPLAWSLVESFVGLYFLAVETRILGLIRYANEDKLLWK